MITPLHFAHLVAFTPGDFFWSVQDFYEYSWYIWLSPIVNSSNDICSSRTHKCFFSCETWKTSCTSNNCGGSSSWYATSPLCSGILSGPIYLGESLPLIMKRRSPLICDTFRYAKSPTWKLNFLLLWSTELFCLNYASCKFFLTTWTWLSTSQSISGPKNWFSHGSF
jgi:hypothetical protein